MTGEPVTHDYSHHRGWGHDYSIIRADVGGQRLRACLFSSQRIRSGDFVLLQNGDRSTRYRVEGEPQRPTDPGDQYFADLTFAPRGADQ